MPLPLPLPEATEIHVALADAIQLIFDSTATYPLMLVSLETGKIVLSTFKKGVAAGVGAMGVFSAFCFLQDMMSNTGTRKKRSVFTAVSLAKHTNTETKIIVAHLCGLQID